MRITSLTVVDEKSSTAGRGNLTAAVMTIETNEVCITGARLVVDIHRRPFVIGPKTLNRDAAHVRFTSDALRHAIVAAAVPIYRALGGSLLEDDAEPASLVQVAAE